MIFNKKHLIAIGISTALLTTQSSYVLAAEEEGVERIEITGSHIKRLGMEGPSPVTSISSEDIANTGVTDLIGLFTLSPLKKPLLISPSVKVPSNLLFLSTTIAILSPPIDMVFNACLIVAFFVILIFLILIICIVN